MALDGILLGLLRRPASGYELKQAFDTVFSHIWGAEFSQIYRTLKQLERTRCLKSRREPSDKGPDKRVYEITPKGRRRLRDWLDSGPSTGQERFAFVAQLYFLGELGDLDRTRRYLEELHGKFSKRCAALKAMESEWQAADPTCPDGLAPDAFHSHMTLRMGIARSEALARWAEESLRRVRQRLKEK